jgi:hypothetical protein
MNDNVYRVKAARDRLGHIHTRLIRLNADYFLRVL